MRSSTSYLCWCQESTSKIKNRQSIRKNRKKSTQIRKCETVVLSRDHIQIWWKQRNNRILIFVTENRNLKLHMCLIIGIIISLLLGVANTHQHVTVVFVVIHLRSQQQQSPAYFRYSTFFWNPPTPVNTANLTKYAGRIVSSQQCHCSSSNNLVCGFLTFHSHIGKCHSLPPLSLPTAIISSSCFS